MTTQDSGDHDHENKYLHRSPIPKTDGMAESVNESPNSNITSSEVVTDQSGIIQLFIFPDSHHHIKRGEWNMSRTAADPDNCRVPRCMVDIFYLKESSLLVHFIS